MTVQSYLVVEDNVVTNGILWDGNIETWQPPEGAIMLLMDETPAKIWMLNPEQTDYVLTEMMGAGAMGFTWDGSILTTNDPKPELPFSN